MPAEVQLKRAIMIVVMVFLPPMLAAALMASHVPIPLVSLIVAAVIALLILSVFRPGSGFIPDDPDNLPVYEGPIELSVFGRVELLLTEARIWVLRSRDGRCYRLEMESPGGKELHQLLQGTADADLSAMDEVADGNTIVTIWRE